jgi:hypothetical protein
MESRNASQTYGPPRPVTGITFCFNRTYHRRPIYPSPLSEVFRKLTGLKLAINLSPPMKPENLLPCSQEPTIVIYPEPDEFNLN